MRFSTRRPTRFRGQFPPDLLADPQALLNRFFVVDPNTSVLPGEIDGSTLLGKRPDPAGKRRRPADSDLSYPFAAKPSPIPVREKRADTVIGLGDDLQELLEKQYGYEVLHITEAFDMKEGCLERSRAYNYAEPVIAAALEEHPSIQVVIDLHRDGVNGSKRLVTKSTESRPRRSCFSTAFPHERKRRTDKPAQSVSGGKPCIFLSDGV